VADVHVDPFHISAHGPPSKLPTAMHQPALTHDTPAMYGYADTLDRLVPADHEFVTATFVGTGSVAVL
jgi:hypothetical protein